MTVIDTQKKSGGSDKDFVILPSDVYRMKILKAVFGENPYGEVNSDGTKPMQITLTWEVTTLSDEQREAADEANEDWETATIPQYLNPFYGPVRRGGVSKFQQFIDGLREQGYLPNFDPRAFDIETLIGIEQRVSVEKYIKSQGDNAGKPGNKVVSILPLRTKKAKAEKNVPQSIEAAGVVAEKDLPF